MNYYISDLHLFHGNSIKLDGRPFGSLDEMQEVIRNRWNGKVTNGDKVYILGDASMRGRNYSLVLCHYPIFSWKGMGKGALLLYGHTHDSAEDDYYQKCLAGMRNNDCRHIYKTEGRAINVGCMKPWMDYEPRTLQEILEYGNWDGDTEVFDRDFEEKIHVVEQLLWKKEFHD